jgi:hypothetical protein
MKSLDYTLDVLPGNIQEIQYAILPFGNPIPILQQTKSEITTNPFIKEEVKPIIVNPTFNEINQNLSRTFINVLDDLLNKPSKESWSSYLQDVLYKNERLNYIAILIFFLVLYMLLIK